MIYIYTTFLFIQKFQQQHPVYPERFKESSPIAQARILPRLLPIYLSIRCRVMGLRHANTRGRPADNKCLNDTRWGKRGYIQESFASFVACFFRTVINATRYSSFPANVFYAYKVSASIWVYIYHGIYRAVLRKESINWIVVTFVLIRLSLRSRRFSSSFFNFPSPPRVYVQNKIRRLLFSYIIKFYACNGLHDIHAVEKRKKKWNKESCRGISEPKSLTLGTNVMLTRKSTVARYLGHYGSARAAERRVSSIANMDRRA